MKPNDNASLAHTTWNWDAVDFRNKTVTIRHKVTESTVDKKLVLIAKDKLKTKSSHRTMPLLAEVERRLLAEKERQNRNRKLCKTASGCCPQVYRFTTAYVRDRPGVHRPYRRPPR